MNKTSIEWVKNPDGSQGYTFNPITGCLNNCSYCYARKLANTRLKGAYRVNTNLPTHNEPDHIAHHLDPFYPRFWEDRLYEPIWLPSSHRPPSPKGIFVCDMSDLFGIGIPEEWTRRVMDVIRTTPYNRYYLLTKQPQNLIKFDFPDNCWVGVTATNHEMAFNASCNLISIKAKVKYISFEPLLGHIGPAVLDLLLKQIQWVIIGQRTPIKQSTTPKIEWVQEIVEACDWAGIPVFLKNNLWDCLYTNAWDDDIFWASEKAKLRQELPQ